jgi:hypothetical protein
MSDESELTKSIREIYTRHPDFGTFDTGYFAEVTPIPKPDENVEFTAELHYNPFASFPLTIDEIDEDYTPDEIAWVYLLNGQNIDGTPADPELVDTARRSVGHPRENRHGELSVEQMCRNLLQWAIREELVSPTMSEDIAEDPQELSSGDLTGMANVLASYFRDNPRRVSEPGRDGGV